MTCLMPVPHRALLADSPAAPPVVSVASGAELYARRFALPAPHEASEASRSTPRADPASRCQRLYQLTSAVLPARGFDLSTRSALSKWLHRALRAVSPNGPPASRCQRSAEIRAGRGAFVLTGAIGSGDRSARRARACPRPPQCRPPRRLQDSAGEDKPLALEVAQEPLGAGLHGREHAPCSASRTNGWLDRVLHGARTRLICSRARRRPKARRGHGPAFVVRLESSRGLESATPARTRW
jgi:hypothetical protein